MKRRKATKGRGRKPPRPVKRGRLLATIAAYGSALLVKVEVNAIERLIARPAAYVAGRIAATLTAAAVAVAVSGEPPPRVGGSQLASADMHATARGPQ
jgi:hypothetical protein